MCWWPVPDSLSGPALRATCAAALLGLLAGQASGTTLGVNAQTFEARLYLPIGLLGSFGPPPVTIVRPSATPSPTMTRPPTETVSPEPSAMPSPSQPPGTDAPRTPTAPTATDEPPVPTPVRRMRPGRVSGSVYASFEPESRIAVADVSIRLVSLDDGSEVARSATDLYGSFHFPPQPAGTYGICWEAEGFPGECVEPPVDVANADAVVQPFRVQAEPGVVYGRVSLREGEACQFSDSARGIQAGTSVQLLASDGRVLGSAVRANALGEYVLAGLPTAGSFRVQARCEGSLAEARLVDPGDAPRRIDLVFENARPVLSGFEARLAGRGLRVAAPGDRLELEAMAEDANSDPLTYDWYTLPGAGSLESAEGGRAIWQLPEAPGLHTLYLLVSDGRGGYARGRLPMEVREGGGARFAGRVVDAETGVALEGASLRVASGGAQTGTLSAAGGRFAIETPGEAESEAILYLHRQGYAPLVSLRDGEARGATFALDKLQEQVFDPALPVRLVDRRPAALRARQPIARVDLPAASLVGIDDGLPPNGMVTGASGGPIIRIGGDGGSGQGFPPHAAQQGRSLGFDREGTPRHLDAYGTISIAFHDGAGKAYAPRPGTVLEMGVPIGPSLAISAPTTAPIWFLDGVTGYWQNTFGRAELVETAEGPMYVGAVTVPESPSSLVEQLYQIALPDGFNLSCVRVAPDATVRPGTTLRAEVRSGNTTLATYQQPIVLNQTFYPFLQIQKASSLRLSLFDTQGQLIATATTSVPLATRPFVAGEGAANIPAPYSACGAPIPLSIPLPGDVALDASGEPVFLTGFGFPDYTAQGISLADVTAAYYAGVDPQGQRTSLSKWWQLNGFGVKGDAPGGSGELVAAYLNHNDLGFGREMHCLRTGLKVACWVSNYGSPDFGPETGYSYPSNADLAAAKSGPGPTVTMEFTSLPADPGRRFVSFYAFGGGTGSAPRIDSVDLDGSYPKAIPQVCAVCHGGRYEPIGPTTGPSDPLSPTIDDLDFGASFREWDLPSLRYSLGRDDSQLSPAEFITYRAMNELVRDHTAPAAAIGELLDGWYGPLGNPLAGPAPDLSFVPPGFVGPAESGLYHDVVAPSCRTCHIARGTGQDFNAYAGELDIRRSAIEYMVCGSGKFMPNARLTFNNFWWSTNPHRPASLAAWDDGANWTPAIGLCK